MIEISVEHRLGSFRLAAELTSEAGVTALFGRSGSGKTSLVNIVAGLIRPDRGRVVLDGDVLVDTDRRIHVLPHRRRIGYVFQDGRLFPHLSVRRNLLFGASRRRGAGELPRVADLLGIGHLLQRRPAGLSGGEKQRVAIGRALLCEPRLLLMDEPLSALDEARRADILPYLERIRDEARIPILYVSHTVAEVARLASATAIISDGRVEAVGPTAELLRRADLVDLLGAPESGSVIVGRVAAHDDEYDLTGIETGLGRLVAPRLLAAPGSDVKVRIRAREVILSLQRPTAISALNVLEGVVLSVTLIDRHAVLVDVACGSERVAAQVTRRSRDDLRIEPGLGVFALVKSLSFDGATLLASRQGSRE